MPRLSKIGAAALAAFGWTGLSTVTATYLQVAGGGGGSGGSGGGGGGAGGYLTGTTSLNSSITYTITVGAGGIGGASSAGSLGTNGSNSQFGTLTASVGGGTGGSFAGTTSGATGGSGGGGSYQSGTGGAGTSGQGNAGGSGAAAFTRSSGGGGGAGAVGSNGVGNVSGGAGGVGLASSISGTSTYYAGGGGGGSETVSGGTGGNGGGGTGATNAVSNGTSGTSNTGGGGGGGYSTSLAGNGGSGVVIISYVGAQQFGGGVVTSSGGYTIHTFNTSGTLAPLSSLTASYLIVAGGAGGGGTDVSYNGAGGGGAGGYQAGSGLTIDTNSTYLVTVGSGGAGGTTTTIGGAGSNSSFSIYGTASVGGGSGGSSSSTAGNRTGGNGGSGGGGAGDSPGPYAGGTGTSGQGNAGGSGIYASSYGGGGGGGASAAGQNAGATSGNGGGNGGGGTASSISGTSTYYAGGGGGGKYASGGTGVPGTGGTGGGGNGGTNGGGNGFAGTTNTGGGGGGATTSTSSVQVGGAGGSGIVIISYAGSTQLMAGGTVTISGGNVIHTFTSSGYLTPLKLVNNSLRFRSSANAYLNRTPSTSNGTIWTYSAWVKLGAISTSSSLYYAYSSGTDFTNLAMNSDGTINFYTSVSGTAKINVKTTAVYRDPAAWYHLVVVYNGTAGSLAFNIYINGVNQALTVTTGQAAAKSYIGNNVAQYISNNFNQSAAFDGYLTEVNFIDGLALTPFSFGTFNSYGVWQPITYGGSYGTNGFYLPFTNKTSTTTLGYDFSPAGNNWTTNNISLTAGSTYDSMTDVPTLTSATAANTATFNPLDYVNNNTSSLTLTNGNLLVTRSTNAYGGYPATMTLPTSAAGGGKFAFEFTAGTAFNGSTTEAYIGIAVQSNGTFTNSSASGYAGDYYTCVNITGGNGYVQKKISGGAVTNVYTGGSAIAANDVFQFLVDMTNGTVDIKKNGSAYGTQLTGLPTTLALFPYVSMYTSASSVNISANFGQQPYASTPTTGYLALNTYNI